jgi:hypothetical protein
VVFSSSLIATPKLLLSENVPKAQLSLASSGRRDRIGEMRALQGGASLPLFSSWIPRWQRCVLPSLARWLVGATKLTGRLTN